MTPFDRAERIAAKLDHGQGKHLGPLEPCALRDMIERAIEDAIVGYRTRYEAAIRERDAALLKAEKAMELVNRRTEEGKATE